jgi:uncharacterized protein YggU (UPF0235/DUF167 family)
MYIKVKVFAGEKINAIKQKTQDSFEIKVKAPAQRGLANGAARLLLAEYLKIEPKKLRLIKGAASPSKIFKLI